jgi:ABC-type multidrug transport system ATPase subunit
MMHLQLTGLGKRFNRHWIFRHLDFTFEAGGKYAITGPNGSGKSTLLQVIAGTTQLSEGRMAASLGSASGTLVPPEAFYSHLGMAAPYLELIEELTLTEFLDFHFSLKPVLEGLDTPAVIAYVGLTDARNRAIRHFSSGMKQRVKLAQVFFAQNDLLLLDEPTTNFDREGIALYHKMVADLTGNRTLIICSNEEEEIGFCQKRLLITDYKN